MPIEFRKASRANAPLKLALVGPASSGKSYTSLLLASKLRDEPKVCVLDTESGRSEKYSDLVEFDWVALTKNFSPLNYIAAINEIEAAGYNILIIDSLTHAWSGPGGVLEIQDKLNSGELRLGNSRKGDNWGNFRHSKALWRRLMDVILTTRMDVILCVRAKTDWEETTDKDGNKKKVKVGYIPNAEGEMDYEVDLLFNLERNHSAAAEKDTTRLYDNHMGGILTADDGAKLNAWRKSAPSTWTPLDPKPDEPDLVSAISRSQQEPKPTETAKVEQKATPAPKETTKAPTAKSAPAAQAKKEPEPLSGIQRVMKVEKNPNGAKWTTVTTDSYYLFMRDPQTVDANPNDMLEVKFKPTNNHQACFDGEKRSVAEIIEWKLATEPEVEGPITDKETVSAQ